MGRKRTGSSYVNLQGGREHKLLFANVGVIPLSGEVVHHIDGNRRNNNLDNLVVMSNREHIKLHTGTYGEPDSFEYVPVVCSACSKERLVQYRCTKRGDFTGLCKSCNGRLNGVHKNKED